MPLYTPAPRDPLSEITRFEISPVLEMLQSIQVLLDPVRLPQWRRRVIELIGTKFIDHIMEIYRGFHGGWDFHEFPIGMGMFHDIPTFLETVATLPPRRFLYFVLGRLYPEEDLPTVISADSVVAFIESRGTMSHHQHLGANFDWCDNLPATQQKVVNLWKEYYSDVFSSEMDMSDPAYQESIDEKQAILTSEGGTALLRMVTGMNTLPRPVPEGSGYHEIVYVPIRMFQRSHSVYFGYGNATILYDVRLSKRSIAQQKELRNLLVARHRALGDKVRMQILRLIASNEYKYNGQRVAEYVGLSPSVVSRHLKQLREAGLIEEHSPDNRNTLYRLSHKTIEELSAQLLSYLTEL